MSDNQLNFVKHMLSLFGTVPAFKFCRVLLYDKTVDGT